MWEAQVRTDGLLRGSRDERIQQMLVLKNKSWKLDALLEIHCGLLDHAHDVREAAMETLLGLAARKTVAIPISPEMLLAYYMGTFTVASGIDLAVVRCLAALAPQKPTICCSICCGREWAATTSSSTGWKFSGEWIARISCVVCSMRSSRQSGRRL